MPAVFDVWKVAAPNLDWISPDIYVDDFRSWLALYAQYNGVAFVPEARFVVGNLFETLGRFNGIGFASFDIENGLPDNQIA